MKHGDLDSSLYSPSHDLDVHMNAAGSDFSCQRCHLPRRILSPDGPTSRPLPSTQASSTTTW
ncbi:MAG: hypothetical protein R2864_08900 [Syntrophotaleaceae bacterium]